MFIAMYVLSPKVTGYKNRILLICIKRRKGINKIFMKTIKLTIDDDILKKYNQYYFEKYPKRRKEPIEQPYQPSINKWMILQRQSMNSLKQKWKDFMVWFIEYCGYKNFLIEECTMTFTTYFKTKIRHDSDNFVPKFILDGLVESGFIVDDDSRHLKSITLVCEIDKEHPRTEIDVFLENK